MNGLLPDEFMGQVASATLRVSAVCPLGCPGTMIQDDSNPPNLYCYREACPAHSHRYQLPVITLQRIK